MSAKSLFHEAHRRVCIVKQRNETQREKIWVGLGTPFEMRPLTDKGWLRPVNASVLSRTLSWYVFTETGWQEYDRRFAMAPDYFAETGNAT